MHLYLQLQKKTFKGVCNSFPASVLVKQMSLHFSHFAHLASMHNKPMLVVLWGGDGFPMASMEYLGVVGVWKMFEKRGGGGGGYGVSLWIYMNEGLSKFESFVKYEVGTSNKIRFWYDCPGTFSNCEE